MKTFFSMDILSNIENEASRLFFKKTRTKFKNLLLILNKDIILIENNFQAEIQALKFDKNKQEEEIQVLKSDKNKQEEEIRALKSDKNKQEEEIRALKSDKNKQEEEIQALKSDKNKQEEEIQALKSNKQKQEDEIQVLKSDKQKQEDEIQSLKSDKNKQEEEIQALKSNKQKQEDEIQSLKSDKNKQEEEIQALKSNKQKQEDEIQVLKSDKQKQEDEIQVLKSDKQKQEDEIQVLKSDKQKQEDEIYNLNKKNYELVEVKDKFDLVGSLLSSKPKEHKELIEFKNVLNEFYEFANEESSLANEAEAVFTLQGIEKRLEIIVNFSAIYNKNIIAIGGGFSSGKSTFINSLFSQNNPEKRIKLPVGTIPVTAIPTYVVFNNLGDDFLSEVGATERHVLDWPEASRVFPGWDELPVVRSAGVRVFPYRVLYYLTHTEVVIVAYAHNRRKPRYWEHRLDG